MGNCCSNPQGENGEDFIRRIFSPFKYKNNFDIKNILEDLKPLLKEDCIFTGDFITYMQRFWSEDKETRELQKFAFVKYFQLHKAKEIGVYEIMLLILPFLNMSTKEKLNAFKSLIGYLQKNKTIVFPRTIREIVYHYYFFHTVLITKIYINYLDLKIKQSINQRVFNTSSISNETNNSLDSQSNIKLEKDSDSVALNSELTILKELVRLSNNVYNETNLSNEINNLFDETHVENVDVHSNKKKVYETIVKERLEKDKLSKVDYDKPKHFKTNYEMSEEYSKNMEQLKSDKSYLNNPKALNLVLVNFTDIREHFFDNYSDKMPEKDS